jgi:tRNA (guanine37-N1)-methyltransferase
MITFDIITIFPEIFDSYFKESFIKKAQEKRLIKINIHNLRDFTTDKHKTVDDRPYGGGLGMVVKVEPIFRAIKEIKKKLKIKNQKLKVVLFTPRGKKFNQRIAYQLSKLNRIIMICGRYEGVDERVAKYIADMELSIGDYDLMGGELPAMILIETVARLIPGVLGKPQLLKERITKERGFVEYAQCTRPDIFSPRKGVCWKVPKVLLSGNHKKIEEWRKKHSKIIEK